MINFSFVLCLLLEQEVLDVALKVKEKTYSATSTLQDVIANNETSEITLNVVSKNLKGTLDFTLTSVPTGTVLASKDGITGAAVTKTGELKVTVPAKLGDYAFTLTNNNKVKTVTVHVVDATMPTSFTFKEYRDEDVSTISDIDVKANTTSVRKASSLANNTDAPTFQGNVNLMKETTVKEKVGKYYRVRIEVKGIDTADVVAVNQETKREYETTPVGNNTSEVYVLLDANEAEVKLVLKNKKASNKQVDNATTHHTIKFESTSKVWLRSVAECADESFKNISDSITKIKIDESDNHTIDVGVKLDELDAVKLNTEANGIIKAGKDENGDKWIGFAVKLAKDDETEKSGVIGAVYSDKDYVKVDNKWIASSGEIVLWVKAEKAEEPINFTLVYNKSNEPKEELPVTVVLHDSSAPIIKSATAGSDVNKKGIKVNAVTTYTQDTSHAGSNGQGANKIVSGYNIPVDTYKYGMDKVTMEKTEGRWYSVVLKTNVPVSSLVFNNGTDSNPKWTEFPKEAIISENEVAIWINADLKETSGKSTKSVQQTIANKYAIEEDDKTGEYQADKATAEWTVGVTVTETEKSKTETYIAGQEIFTDSVQKNKELAELNLNKNVTVIEKIYDNQATLKHNLNPVTPIAISYDSTHRVNTLTINSSDYKTIEVNETEGLWTVVNFAVRDSSSLVDGLNMPDTIFVDKVNDGQLLTTNTVKNENTKGETWDVVPMWINLSSPKLVDYISTNKATKNAVLEIPLISTNPAEENSLFIKIIDENVNEPLKTVEEPSVETPESFKNEDGGVDKGKVKDYLGWESTNLLDNDVVDAFMNNLEIANNAEKTIDHIVDNTVYMTVKADFGSLKAMESNRYRLPLEFDISSIGLDNRDELAIYAAWYEKEGEANDSLTELGSLVGTTEYELMKFNFSKETIGNFEKGQSRTCELFFINGEVKGKTNRAELLKEIADKQFIRYVVTFEQVQ